MSSRFIILTSTRKDFPIAIRAEHIDYVIADDEYTIIGIQGKEMYVTETMDEVKEKVCKALQSRISGFS